ncbi:septum formation family protein [Nocardioides sp.]|uniref:septum formation family protein n=1 Tax=Nocardioides sp. TaxID=35761 RepID=UPI00262B8F57|nr:septum formation family protein [Nocardioides sp.]
MIGVRRAVITAVAAGTVLLGGCGGSEPAATPTPTPPAHASAVPNPADRACYRLSYADAVAPTAPSAQAVASTAVSCAKGHTSETFYVGALSDVVDGHLVAVDSTRIQRQSARTCPAKLSAYLGGSVEDLRLSMLRAVWFTPTVADSETGAAWLRCDVIAVAGKEKLATVTGSLKGSLASGAGAEAMCGTAAPSATGFERVPCAQKHTWKALKVVTIAGEKYPGTDAAKAAGQTICKNEGKAVASNALDYSWSYEWPTAEQWDAGQTYGICWAPQA